MQTATDEANFSRSFALENCIGRRAQLYSTGPRNWYAEEAHDKTK